MKREPLKRGPYDPTVNSGGEIVALRRGQEGTGPHNVSVLVLQPQQQFIVLLFGVSTVDRNNGLKIEMEATFVERSSYSFDPLHLPASRGEFRVVFTVDMNAVAPFVFGRIAGVVRRP